MSAFPAMLGWQGFYFSGWNYIGVYVNADGDECKELVARKHADGYWVVDLGRYGVRAVVDGFGSMVRVR